MIRTRGSEQFRVSGRSSQVVEEFAIFSSDFSIRASVTAGVALAATAEEGRGRGESCGERGISSPVLMTEVSMWKVEFSVWVKRLVRAGED